MEPGEMTIPYRAWATETCFGHCLFGDRLEPLPPLGYDSRRYAQELVDLLRWGTESGINGVFLSHGDRGGFADPGGIALEAEALRLRLPFSVGGHVGHGFPHFLPPALFGPRPELFRQGADGQRTPTGNLCTADPESIGRAVGELTKLLDRHPRARLLQIWPEDVMGGSWCHCDHCRERSPVEQYADLTAAIAGGLDARASGAEVGFLLYHDTLTGLPSEPAAAGARPFVPPNVYALYAPRERCYAHAIDDATCSRNRRYWQGALRAQDVFAGRVDVFEYYGDTILWQYFNAAIPHVIAADLRAYRHLGVREIQALTFGTYSRWAHGLNLATFAWLASGAECDADAAVARYAREQFGAAFDDAMTDYYLKLEEASRLYLGFCGYADDWMDDLRAFTKPSPAYPEHRQRVAASAELLAGLSVELDRLTSRSAADDVRARLQAEQAHLEITRIELKLLAVRLAAAERANAGGSLKLTDAEQTGHRAARATQWKIAQSVPAALHGQAFWALAAQP